MVYDGLNRLGKETTTITVDNCRNNPVVAKMKVNQAFKLVNNTEKEYKMRFSSKDFTLSAGESVNLEVPNDPSRTFHVLRCTTNPAPRNGDPIPGVVYSPPS
jgi:hypothetical protein